MKNYAKIMFLSLLIVCLMIFSFTACGSENTPQQENVSETSQTENVTSSITNSSESASNSDNDNSTANDSSDDAEETDGNGVLIAYFSRADENYNVGVIEKGNTEIIAEMIAEETGGRLFHIERETPYPATYNECIDEARQEQNDNARPALLEDIENIDEYDIIFIGYPIWWGDLPMPVYTFLESHDFMGKTIVPFNTHEGSGQSGTARTIEDICSGATVLEGLAVRGQTAQNDSDEAKEAVLNWLSSVMKNDI